MPELPGARDLGTAAPARPELRVLFTTGYADDRYLARLPAERGSRRQAVSGRKSCSGRCRSSDDDRRPPPVEARVSASEGAEGDEGALSPGERWRPGDGGSRILHGRCAGCRAKSTTSEARPFSRRLARYRRQEGLSAAGRLDRRASAPRSRDHLERVRDAPRREQGAAALDSVFLSRDAGQELTLEHVNELVLLGVLVGSRGDLCRGRASLRAR